MDEERRVERFTHLSVMGPRSLKCQMALGVISCRPLVAKTKLQDWQLTRVAHVHGIVVEGQVAWTQQVFFMCECVDVEVIPICYGSHSDTQGFTCDARAGHQSTFSFREHTQREQDPTSSAIANADVRNARALCPQSNRR